MGETALARNEFQKQHFGSGETIVELGRNPLRSGSESGVPAHLQHNLEDLLTWIPGATKFSPDPCFPGYRQRFNRKAVKKGPGG